MHDQAEIDALLTKPAGDRFEYFLDRAIEDDAVWMLRDEDGFCAFGDQSGDVFPLWPGEAFAAIFARDDWATAKPVRVALSDVLEKLLPAFEQDGTRVSIFAVPAPAGTNSMVVEARPLADAIRERRAERGA